MPLHVQPRHFIVADRPRVRADAISINARNERQKIAIKRHLLRYIVDMEDANTARICVEVNPVEGEAKDDVEEEYEEETSLSSVTESAGKTCV